MFNQLFYIYYTFTLLQYISIIIIVLYITYYLYFKLKHNFWSIQPVVHYYNVIRRIKPCGIINKELPLINKYCNLNNIQTFDYINLTSIDKQLIVNFLSTYYLRSNNSDSNYLPTFDSFNDYFKDHPQPSYVSIYSNPTALINYGTKEHINYKEIISVLTTRPLHITINNNNNKPIEFLAYYVDNLCVHPLYRKKHISPQIIQTHEWYQRHNNSKINISLFKREGEITGILPFISYNTFAYKKLPVFNIKNTSMQIVKITSQSLNLFIDFIKENYKQFDIIITQHVANILNLINKHVFIYVMKSNNIIVSCYLFRNTHTLYNNKLMIECFGSINAVNDNIKNDIFYKGFTLAYYDITKFLKSKFIIIENVSHNGAIIDKLIECKHIVATSPTAFFFYNYSTKSYNPNKVFIMY